MAIVDRYELSDRYTSDAGTVFLSGSQALARLPLEQLRADRCRGWNTAVFVSGYPGSPLAGYDRDAAAVGRLAEAEGFTFVVQPGLNEELAATAVMGSQLAVTQPSCSFDGIVGIWYGKAPGLDRASDAIRHANFAGTAPRSGAVALVADDPSAKSSTLPSSSDATLVDLHIPLLYPGDVQEALDLGRHAIALSRACGLWTSLKIVESIADGTGTVDLGIDRISPVIPELEVDGRPWVPRPSGRLITPYSLELEREFTDVKLVLAEMYARANHLNSVQLRGPDDWIGLIACGHTYKEALEALHILGLRTDDQIRAAGVRLFNAAMPIQLDHESLREFADGLTEVFVIEEKNPTLESLVKEALYDLAVRPVIVGKQAPDGTKLIARAGHVEADNIVAPLRSRLGQRLSDERLVPLPPAPRARIPLSVARSPYFCSGCPHNTSTRVPEGTLVGAGIGCHTMVMLMDGEHTGEIVGLTQMGGEGLQWVGMAPFVTEQHLVQNIGDGTLFHSGILAIRAAAASGVNITYKILYNGAVAMTGGQDACGGLPVPQLAQALQAEGVQRIIVTTEDLDRYRRVKLPDDVEVWDRERIIEAQEVLAKVPGCTVLIHDQRCAAEKRRDRKRGRIATPGFRVVINERVCEGCGDCGDKSNCLSVQPIDTPWGRKTRIDQGSCNFDLSCMNGDCPSFMTVTVDDDRPSAKRVLATPPAGPPVTRRDVTIRLSGIGGTGVVTISQILGTAAMLDGYTVRGLDQTGLSQKAGPVVSDVRLTVGDPQPSNKATRGSVDTLLAFDELVAGSDLHLAGLDPERTTVVASSAAVPTGRMIVNPGLVYPAAEIDARLDGATRDLLRVDAAGLARRLIGDDATANVMLLGIAVQAGAVPVSVEAVERAIALNGVAVEKNLAAFAWGRSWVADRPGTEAAAGVAMGSTDDRPLVERLAADLADYQDDEYAERFRAVVAKVAAAGQPVLTDAVARNLHKLMAYKDEYEVARLLLLPEARAQAEAVGGKGTKVTWHLHPPMLRSMGMRHKMRLGRWAKPSMHALRAARRVRGTKADVFGHAEVRKIERAMIPEYIAAVDTLLARLPDTDLDELVAIAELPDQVRGYEDLKLRRAEAYRTELQQRLTTLRR